VLAPLVAMIVLIGVWPHPFLERIGPSVAGVIARVGGR
jgi:NADH:ubiquinone oxidoreductase subunit 4 (subunit M)